MPAESFENSLAEARGHANFGRNAPFLEICEKLANECINDNQALVIIASLLMHFGFTSQAHKCLKAAVLIASHQRDTQISLAYCALQMGDELECQRIYQELLKLFPDDLKVLGHLIYLSQYLEGQSDKNLLRIAKHWGDCAIRAAGGYRPRPPIKHKNSKPIKIGYVSSDFCQHTVGLLIKEVLANHDANQFSVSCYSSGNVHDWVTDFIAQHSIFVNVTQLSDQDLVKRIEQDQIDILVDLSGHTGGSRLAAFAYRPAPVMLSMLGYYATTGLEYMDGTLLDGWHVHEDTQTQFIEPVLTLSNIRWCFYPAFPAPLISPPPAEKNGYITFGSFNNTLKYNAQVFDLWAKILHAVPDSKLILKWRTFNDSVFKQYVWDRFEALGIEASRVDLRGPSFHMQMLEEYSDVDIALDPFPFSGGVTSCEALYMGVPVITMPTVRVVSRQTYGFLSNIECTEFVAYSKQEYAEKAVELAQDIPTLIRYRQTLRGRMIDSPLMQVKTLTTEIEKVFLNTNETISNKTTNSH